MANQYADRIEAAYDGFGAAHLVAFPAAAADYVGYQRAARIVGWSLRETATAVATVRLLAGQSAADGVLIDSITLAADAAHRSFFGDRGILCPNGVFVDRVAGTVEVSLWIRDWLGDAAV